MKPAYILLFTLLFSTMALAGTRRYRLTLRDNPATTITVGWEQYSGSNATVYYGTIDYGTNWSQYPSSRSVDRSVSYRGMNNRFARITGLQPNTYYYFVIRDNEGTSQRFYFKTAPDNPNERLSFIAGGDSRNNRTPRRNANTLVSKLKPTAVLFGGDMTDDDTNSQWQGWFDDWQNTISSDGRMYPIVATRGNHENSNSTVYNLFDTPSSSVYYAITFGGNLIRTYTLNTESSISGSQTTWLANDLANSGNVTWKVAQYHKGMRPHVSSKSEGNTQYNSWANLFYNNDVQLVVECDAHTVKTTWPIRPSTGSGSDEGFIRDDQNGSVYVGEGCWGAPLRSNNDSKNWTRNSGRFNQFKWFFVDQDKIELRTIQVDNASSVGSVSNSNPFQIPSNLDIWNPSNGSVVVIPNGGGTTPPNPNVVDRRIASGNDDVEEEADGSMYMNSTDLELVQDGNRGNQTVGMRFNNITIPQGATIDVAYVQFTTDETNSGTTNLTIRGQDTNNAPAFSTSANNVSSRALTSASVSWSPSSWSSVGQAGSNQRTPELKSILQEIVNRSGWSSGNSMVLTITGSGERTAEAFEGSSSEAALLHIEFSENSTPTTPNAPSALAATAISSSQINLTWTDNSGVETGYLVERNSGGGFTQIASLGANTTSYSNSGLAASTSYSYRVRAVNAGVYSSYSNTASATTDQATGGPCPGCIDFSVTATVSYSNQDIDANVQVQDNGATLYLEDNTWRRTNTRYNITANTKIEFEFKSTSQGEIHGIGVDADDTHSNTQLLQIYGTQNWAIRDYSYTQAGSFQTLTIPIGDYFTGSMYLTLVNDNDAGSNNTSWFRNVRIYEDGPTITIPAAPGSLSASSASTSQINLSWTDNSNNEDNFVLQRSTGGSFSTLSTLGANTTSYQDIGLNPATTYSYRVAASNSAGTSSYSNTASATTDPVGGGGDINIDFNTLVTVSYSNQDASQNVSVISGPALRLEDNTWRRTTSTYTITPNTVIELEFGSTNEGEIHGIGFDADDNLSSSQIFQFYGTQNWGNRTYDYTNPGYWQTITVPVGTYYTGSNMYLVFVNDNDNGSNNNSYFRNVRIYEAGSTLVEAPQLSNLNTRTTGVISVLAENTPAGHKNIPELDAALSQFISVYPNPVDQVLFVEYDTAWIGAELRLFGLNGTEILRTRLDDSQKMVLNSTQLNAGMYIIQISDDKGLNYSAKLLKK